jgi:recombination protein RecR
VKAIEDLVSLLARLPGIGKKSASRIAFHVLRADQSYADSLAAAVAGLKRSVRFCPRCGSYAEGELCDVCAAPDRDATLLCVVEQPQDVMVIEASREYKGLYHVLGGLISPLDGIGPDRLRFADLVERAAAASEVIVATNPTVEGDTTALYVQKALAGLQARVTRLATGIPVGGDLEYADRLTLARSFRGRMRMGE